MRIAIVGNDLRCVALARRLQTEGHDVVVVPGADRMNVEVEAVAMPHLVPQRKSMRDGEAILAAVAKAHAELIVCLHVETADAGVAPSNEIPGQGRRRLGRGSTDRNLERSRN